MRDDRILNMEKEADRLTSFQDYVSTECDFTEEVKQNYARAGFYWTSVDEKIQCYFCHFTALKLQADNQDPVKFHICFSSTCPFISRRRTRNIPIDNQLLQQFLPPKARSQLPKYPEYTTPESRKATFRRWPRTNCMRIEDLVAAGFFYSGNGDKVDCYFCGLGLKNFYKGEIPLDSHKNARMDCPFLKYLELYSNDSIVTSRPRNNLLIFISISTMVMVLIFVFVLLGSSMIKPA